MTILHIVLFLGVAGIAGAIGQALAGYSRAGWVVSVAVGFVGAVFGSRLGRLLGLSDSLVLRSGPETFSLIGSLVGATLFVAVLGLATRSPPRVSPRRP